MVMKRLRGMFVWQTENMGPRSAKGRGELMFSDAATEAVWLRSFLGDDVDAPRPWTFHGYFRPALPRYPPMSGDEWAHLWNVPHGADLELAWSVVAASLYDFNARESRLIVHPPPLVPERSFEVFRAWRDVGAVLPPAPYHVADDRLRAEFIEALYARGLLSPELEERRRYLATDLVLNGYGHAHARLEEVRHLPSIIRWAATDPRWIVQVEEQWREEQGVSAEHIVWRIALSRDEFYAGTIRHCMETQELTRGMDGYRRGVEPAEWARAYLEKGIIPRRAGWKLRSHDATPSPSGAQESRVEAPDLVLHPSLLLIGHNPGA